MYISTLELHFRALFRSFCILIRGLGCISDLKPVSPSLAELCNNIVKEFCLKKQTH